MLYALITTVICIVIGYPIAYIISKLKPEISFIILLLFILPMWTNMLLRIQSLNMLLLPEGFMKNVFGISINLSGSTCLLYTSDAADDLLCVDLGGRRIIKKKKTKKKIVADLFTAGYL